MGYYTRFGQICQYLAWYTIIHFLVLSVCLSVCRKTIKIIQLCHLNYAIFYKNVISDSHVLDKDFDSLIENNT